MDGGCRLEPVKYILFFHSQDIHDDIAGAMAIGMKAILVKTGKYLPSVSIDPPPTVVLENFAEAVEWISQQLQLS